MPSRFLSSGIGARDIQRYAGDSIKRGSIQQYRSPGLRDEYVMQRVQMVGPMAYANFCKANNDCAPENLPRFASDQEYLEHAMLMQQEKNMLLDNEGFARFMAEISSMEER